MTVTRIWGRPDPEAEPAGQRLFAHLGPVTLERGGALPEVVVAYETWGRLDADGRNAVLVEHALTGDSHVSGEAGAGHPTAGWWEGLIGPGLPLDTDRHFVVCANVLGGCRGTTGPGTTAPDGWAWGSRFPFVTIRDQVAVERALMTRLGVAGWRAVIGGSMGGMRALEWAVTHPELVRSCLVLASCAAATADQIAWCHPQLAAIRSDPHFHGGDYYGHGEGPATGLALARSIAHTTYRAEPELSDRFGRRAQEGEEPLGGGGRYAVESYLDHHAGKLVGRFDANSYVVLTEAMNSHDIGRGRGGTSAALRRFGGDLVVAPVDSDRLYPARLSHEVAEQRPGTRVHTIHSRHGHDGFLVEVEQVGRLVAQCLEEP